MTSEQITDEFENIFKKEFCSCCSDEQNYKKSFRKLMFSSFETWYKENSDYWPKSVKKWAREVIRETKRNNTKLGKLFTGESNV